VRELVEKRGGELHDADRVRGEMRGEQVGGEDGLGAGDDERGTIEQRAPEFEGRGVENEIGVKGENVVGKNVDVIGGADEAQDAAMGAPSSKSGSSSKTYAQSARRSASRCGASSGASGT
jgi:hypothetical protein